MERREHLTGIAASAAAGDRSRLRRRLRAALADGLPAADLYEALLQVYPFAGVPRALDGLEELRALDRGQPPLEPEPEDPEARGAALFRRIYARHSGAVRRRLEDAHPDLARFVLRDAYGRVLTRPFLDIRERELMAVAMLGALGTKAQLAGHVRGALRCGATPDEVRDAAAEANERLRDLVERTLDSFEE